MMPTSDKQDALEARPRRIYLASSWRNPEQPAMVEFLRAAGHEVYDFRHPNLGRGNDNGFRWSDIDSAWESWTPEQYREALRHPIAVDGFAADKGGMDWADVCVMLAPCGRSAHSEAAYMAGQGKPAIIVLRPGEPELMYGLFTSLVITDEELLTTLAALDASPRPEVQHEHNWRLAIFPPPYVNAPEGMPQSALGVYYCTICRETMGFQWDH